MKVTGSFGFIGWCFMADPFDCAVDQFLLIDVQLV